MDLPVSNSRKMKFAPFNSKDHLAHATQQAVDRGYHRFPIIDVDSHHYELNPTTAAQVVEYIEDPVLKQVAQSNLQRGVRDPLGVASGNLGFQDVGGRITRYPLRQTENTEDGVGRDVALTRRWMDAMGIDITILFPSTMLDMALHPQINVEVEFAKAYNRWFADNVLGSEPRIQTMVYLPFNDPEATYKTVKEFGERKGVVGFMVTSARQRAVYDNAYMKTYALLEEMGMPLGFHGIYNWFDQSFKLMNRFISVHSLGFPFYNMVHMTNWIFNALPERFPKLKLVWIESGLAWVPFMMQRLDHEYMMRTSEAPGLKRLPSEYIQEMYFTTQPMERPEDLSILETTFRMIKAETQLLFSSDYPHWDFDLPSTIYDLPFLKEEAKRNILGGNAMRLFGFKTPMKKMAKPTTFAAE